MRNRERDDVAVANETTGRQHIVEEGINLVIQTDDGRLSIDSKGAGTSNQAIYVDRKAVSTASAVTMSSVTICTPAYVKVAVPETKKVVDVSIPEHAIGIEGRADPLFETTFTPIPLTPFNLATEAIEVEAVAYDSSPLMATSLMDGTMTGDVSPATPLFVPAANSFTVRWSVPLKPDQAVTFRKIFPVSGAAAVEITVPNLVDYTAQQEYIWSLRSPDPYLVGSPIVPGSLKITVPKHIHGSLVVTDNRDGKLVGDVASSSVGNNIDYKTGLIHIVFAEYPEDKAPITATYAVFHEVYEQEKRYKNPVQVKVVIDWNDLKRIVNSAQLAADALEANVKYRVDV